MLAPNSAKTHPAFSSFVAAVRGWARQRRLSRLTRKRLFACDSDEIARIAHDVGLSTQELRHMAALGPNAAKLLFERMAVLHLDADALTERQPSTIRDLQRLCSSCAVKKRCQRDLVLIPDDPDWRQYCPNADTLGALQSEPALVH